MDLGNLVSKTTEALRLIATENATRNQNSIEHDGISIFIFVLICAGISNTQCKLLGELFTHFSTRDAVEPEGFLPLF